MHQIETANIRRTTVTKGGKYVSDGVRSEATALRDIDRDTRRVVAAVKEGVAKDYVRFLVGKTDDADVLSIRTRVAALIMIDGVVPAIEDAATEWVQDQLTRFAVEIKNTTGARRDSFLRVKEQISTPEATGIDLTVNLKAPTKDSNKMDAQIFLRSRGTSTPTAKGGSRRSSTIGRLPSSKPSWIDLPSSLGTAIHQGRSHRRCELASIRPPTGTTPITIAVSPVHF